ncbi:hypothetical protein IW261DRAFT_1399514 [Armillaria novae-zelandiae]|uniref:Heterokaryon incompatibility domain-containing protein n=1 Tax=Armillaria novae-zelandiae TaxID=153914 RepID=A0AA39P8M8_9AGAR|nr:hypothetical protein IW261DRAFT_1399514 [Armillaria novae-zelandiae]
MDSDSGTAVTSNEVVRRRPRTYDKRPNLPDITLTALTETGREELTIPVLKQRSYTGNKRVISSALADTRCAALGVEGVVKRLNAILGTSYSLGSEVVRSIFEPYIERNDDFGTVYSHLRNFWGRSDMEEALGAAKEKERWIQKRMLANGRIETQTVPPRRVWDLCANRVVSYWIAGMAADDLVGISHAWVDENDRVDVMTPINGKEWPVPMPKDANLDLIRIEMLNHGEQITWLDVLCLRQEGGKGEHLRLEEWKLDVPTIGFVYTGYTPVVCYFNGLGRPLHLTPGYFESDRCWFRRAWTLQEIVHDPIIGGETGNDVADDENRKKFVEQLARLQQIQHPRVILELASEMQNRVSSKPLDKVAGLAYLLNLRHIPIYDETISDVDAWEVLMDAMDPDCLTEVFFDFPEPGNGRKYWRPSWQQVMTTKPGWTSSMPWRGCIEYGDTDQDLYEGYFIDSVNVRGLDKGLEEEMPRQGEMVFKTSTGISHTFKISAYHVYPLPDGSYAVAADDIPGPYVVGWLRENREFEKLSVFRLADDEQIDGRELRLKERKISLC